MTEKSTTYELFDYGRCRLYASTLTEGRPDLYYDLPYQVAERFPERKTCGYLSLMAYILTNEFNDLDYRETCLFMIKTLVERRFTIYGSNIKVEENGQLRVGEVTYIDFKTDLKYLQKEFKKLYKNNHKFSGKRRPTVLDYYINPNFTTTTIEIDWKLY